MKAVLDDDHDDDDDDDVDLKSLNVFKIYSIK